MNTKLNAKSDSSHRHNYLSVSSYHTEVGANFWIGNKSGCGLDVIYATHMTIASCGAQGSWFHVPVYAASFNAESSIMVKDNIVNYSDSLNKLLNLNIVEYNKANNSIHQIGLITEDESTPNELISTAINEINNKFVTCESIDLYSFISLVAKALQEHYQECENKHINIDNALAELYENQINLLSSIQLAITELYELVNNLINKGE